MPFDQRLIDYSPEYKDEPVEDFSWAISSQAKAFGERIKKERITLDEQYNER